MRRPWIKFYPADWQADQTLGMCTLAARGLWLEMLAIMHRADPYGHLLVNGKVPTDTQLAALARCPPDQIPSLLDELENAGVFSKGRNRVIYSRRLTRDEKHRKDGETAQKLGGYVPGSRRWQTAEKHAQKTPPPRVVNGVDQHPPLSLDARVQKEEDGYLPETHQSESESSKTALAPSRYAYCGKVVRLIPRDYEAWRKRFHGIRDIDASLGTLDDFYASLPADEQPEIRHSWFIRASKALEKEHQAELNKSSERSARAELRVRNQKTFGAPGFG